LDDDDLRTIGFEREEAERAEKDAVVENLYNFKGIQRYKKLFLFPVSVIFGLHNLEKPKGARIASLTQNYVTVHPNFHKDG